MLGTIYNMCYIKCLKCYTNEWAVVHLLYYTLVHNVAEACKCQSNVKYNISIENISIILAICIAIPICMHYRQVECLWLYPRISW